MRTRIAVALAAATLTMALAPQWAGATTGVTISGATQSGAFVSVSGTATFDDQPFVAIGTDGIGDTLVPGFGALGGDLTSASISTATNGDVRFRFVVSDMLPAPLDGSPTGVIHAWDFCVDGVTCFEIDGGRNGTGVGVVGPYASLWSCTNASCDVGGQTQIGDLAAAMSAATKSFTVTAPAGTVAASPGSIISPASGPYIDGPVITDVGDGGLFPLFEVGDGIASLEEYTVASKTVSAVVGALGQNPASVAYSSTTGMGSGSFTASAATNGLTGEQAVYVRACFGANNCAYATQAVTLV